MAIFNSFAKLPEGKTQRTPIFLSRALSTKPSSFGGTQFWHVPICWSDFIVENYSGVGLYAYTPINIH